MERIEGLREKALKGVISYEKFYYEFYKELLSLGGELTPKNYGIAYKKAFEVISPVIDEGELIVGKPEFSVEGIEGWQALRSELIDRDILALVGQDSHMVVDFELLLGKGISGLIGDINAKLAAETDPEKAEYYNCCISCLEAVADFSDKYSEKAAFLAALETDTVKKAELETVAAICKKVPRGPAETFHEALQAISFLALCLSHDPCRCCSQQFMMGRLDRYLYDYYKNDLESGVLTKEKAQLLLDCFCLQINNRVPNGLSCGYMVGGKTKEGVTVANDLTEMAIQAIDDVKLVYPAVGFCYTDDMPEKYIDKACEVLSHGRSHPAIFNDAVITRGLEEYGVPHSEAVRYSHSTCVEITPEASSNIWVASPYTNLPQLLLDVLKTEPDSYEKLTETFFDELAKKIEDNFIAENENRKRRQKKTIMPLLSCFVNDCLEKGLDINNGGARYNWIMPSFIGMANLVDSFYVLREMIYKEKAMSIGEFNKILENNFEGMEYLRIKCLNGYAKYGNDVDDVDVLFTEISDHIKAECKKHTPLFDSKLIPSVFCWIMHDIYGRVTGATPDGRKANFPLGDGSGPCQGRELKGPTASVLSSTKWSHKEFIGGVAVNMKFSKKTFTENSFATMKNIIKTFMERGGFEMQINVLDRETLLKARENPEEYRDLVVRIGGYSDYYVKLSETMQKEVLLRTEHEI